MISYATPMNRHSDNETVSFLREKGESQMYNEIIIKNKVDTVTKAFNYAVKKYGNRDCLGTRQVLGRLSHPCNYQS